MNRYDSVDLKFTKDGDFALSEDGDLALSEGNELIDQMAEIVLKTTNPDWSFEDFPADLEDLIGFENTKDTASLGKDKIIKSLVKTGFFEEEDIWVEATPVDYMTIAYVVFIRSPFSEKPLVYRINLDLGVGAEIRRID